MRDKLDSRPIYVAFESNQIKRTDNLNPTENGDIRYSLKPFAEQVSDTLQGKADRYSDVLVGDTPPIYQDEHIGLGAMTSYLMQGIPTLGGQIERSSERDRRTTYTETDAFLTPDMQYTLGRTSARIPGWDFQQIPYIDAWGRTEQMGSPAARSFNNFLNPSFTSTIQESKMEQELLRLYEATGKGVFPSRADKYFTVDGKRKDLTAEEYVVYAKLKGEKSYKYVSELTKSQAYKGMNDEQKSDAVSEAYSMANAEAKMAISDYDNADKWMLKAQEAEEKYGIPVGGYIAVKSRIADVDSLKYGSGAKEGKTITGSSSALKMKEILKVPGLSEKQKLALADYMGIGEEFRKMNSDALERAIAQMEKQAK